MKLLVHVSAYFIFIPLYLIASGLEILAAATKQALSDLDRNFLARYK